MPFLEKYGANGTFHFNALPVFIYVLLTSMCLCARIGSSEPSVVYCLCTRLVCSPGYKAVAVKNFAVCARVWGDV